jgi:hypothetical protein
MADFKQLYLPGEIQTPLEPGEELRYSFILSQGKRNWTGLHYEGVAGVWYRSHLTSKRLILEPQVTSSQGFFLQKALIVGLSIAARAYGMRSVSKAGGKAFNQMQDAESAADAARDQTLSIPLESIARVEKSFPAWLRIVLKNPPPDFDPYSLVFLPAPLPGRTRFRTGLATSADVLALVNEALQNCPCDASVVS